MQLLAAEKLSKAENTVETIGNKKQFWIKTFLHSADFSSQIQMGLEVCHQSCYGRTLFHLV